MSWHSLAVLFLMSATDHSSTLWRALAQSRRWLASLCLCFAAPLGAAPVITTIAEDSFSYPANSSLPGNSGGSGWTGPWASHSNFFDSFTVGATSPSVPGVTSSGGSVVFRSGGGTLLNDSVRPLPLQNSGVLFLQFVAQFSTQSGGGTPTIRLFSSGALSGAVGNNDQCSTPVYAILNNNLEAPISAACSTVPLSDLVAVVVRIDYGANTTRMWVLSSLSGFDYLNPPAPSAEYVGLAPVFDRIALYSRDPATIDELRVFRVAAAPVTAAQPVPVGTPALWVGLAGLLGFLASRRLRHPD